MERIAKNIPMAISVPCFDFRTDKYQKEKKTVIIAPIVIREIKADTLQISWACSRGPYCVDKECRYSDVVKTDNED